MGPERVQSFKWLWAATGGMAPTATAQGPEPSCQGIYPTREPSNSSPWNSTALFLSFLHLRIQILQLKGSKRPTGPEIFKLAVTGLFWKLLKNTELQASGPKTLAKQA